MGSDQAWTRLQAALAQTRRKLAEAEQTLHAIRSGAVDAIVVQGSDGLQTYTLKSASEPYRQIVEQMHQAALTVTSEGLIVYCNSAFANLVGAGRERLVGSTFSRFVSRSELARLVAGNGCCSCDLALRRRDGSMIDCDASSAVQPVEDGAIYCVVITNLTRQRLKLRHDAIVEATSNAVFSLSPELIVESWNRGACELYGYTPAEIVGRSVFELLPPEQIAGFETLIARSAGSDVAVAADVVHTHKDAARIDVALSLAPLRDEHGVLTGYAAIGNDISERKRAEKALRDSESRFRGTFENAAVGVAHIGLDGRWLDVNQRLCDIVGYSRSELRERTFQQVTHPDDVAADLDGVRALLAGEIPSYATDKRYVRKDGSLVWIGLTVALQHDEAGAPHYFIAIIRDISERKAAQEYQQFLLLELAHRQNNQLAIIQAMASQTARKSTSLADFQHRFRERVQALAMSADVLLARGWREARLDELVRRQLEPFATVRTKLSCKGPPIHLGAEAIQAIGLALHELATNSVTHGAWSSPTGTVEIVWQVRSDGTSRLLSLKWLERGGPRVQPPRHKGFGHVVIEQMVAQKVGGSAELAFAADGLSWELSIPGLHFWDEARSGITLDEVELEIGFAFDEAARRRATTSATAGPAPAGSDGLDRRTAAPRSRS